MKYNVIHGSRSSLRPGSQWLTREVDISGVSIVKGGILFAGGDVVDWDPAKASCDYRRFHRLESAVCSDAALLMIVAVLVCDLLDSNPDATEINITDKMWDAHLAKQFSRMSAEVEV